MSQASRHDISVRYGSRYGSPDSTDDQGATDVRGSRSCPVCQATLTSRRARYCSDACKQRAYRLRQTDTSPQTEPELWVHIASISLSHAIAGRAWLRAA